MKIDFLMLFNRTISLIFSVMIVIILLTLVVGVGNLFADIYHLAVENKLQEDFLGIIYDVLTLFVMIELLRSIAEYFNTKRLRMTFIVDAAIVFVLREVMIQIFEHKAAPAELYALSVLIVALTVLRVASMLMHQREQRLKVAGRG